MLSNLACSVSYSLTVVVVTGASDDESEGSLSSSTLTGDSSQEHRGNQEDYDEFFIFSSSKMDLIFDQDDAAKGTTRLFNKTLCNNAKGYIIL